MLVCGDRNWTDVVTMELFLYWLTPDDTVIHGAAPGADSLARVIARKVGCKEAAYPANWTYGRRGGPIRNQKMLDEGKPDAVIAFHNDLTHSKGTKDMVSRARKAGLPTYVISSNGGIEDIFEPGSLDPDKQKFLDDLRDLLVTDDYDLDS